MLFSIIVSHKPSPPTWILFLFWLFFTLTLMSNFVLLTESTWDTEWKLATENGDPFYGQTLCHTWVAKPRYHCIVSSPWFYQSWAEAWSVWNIKKTGWFWSYWPKWTGLKRSRGDRQIMSRDCISLKMSVFFFGTLPL